MERLLSNRPNITTIPESYVFPPENRIGSDDYRVDDDAVPVIDLGKVHVASDRDRIVQEIVEASRKCGFFQIINHGISEELMKAVLEVSEELFELPVEEKAKFYSEDIRQSYRMYPSIDYDKERVHFWRDSFRFPCHPFQDHVQSLPDNPPRFRELVGEYSAKIRNVMWWVLDLICEGLGVERGYFDKATGNQLGQSMTMNHYPKCPDPSLTLGLPPHADSGLLTFLLQGQVDGLQLFKDGKWLLAHPHPNALVINIGHSLEIMSNGKVKSGYHRVGTNAEAARTTVGSFINPSPDTIIQPLKAFLLDDDDDDSSLHRPQRLYKPFVFRDFITNYITATHDITDPLESYKI